MYELQDKERLREILERKEYTRYHDPLSGGGIWDWLSAWFQKWWDKLSWPTPHLSDSGEMTVAYGLTAAVLILLAAAIYWFARQVVRKGNWRQKLPVFEDESAWSYREYLRAAERWGDEGAWRDGVRYVFLALLFYLEESRWLKIEKWKTNWEYDAELRRTNGGMAPLFRSSAELFDRVWYGQEAIDEEQWTSFYDRVRAAIRDKEDRLHAEAQ